MKAVLSASDHGPMLVPPYDVYLSQAVIRLGQYGRREFDAWRPYLPDGGVVLDVGANFGALTFAFAQAVGESGSVVAVEPQYALFAMLCGSTALQGRRNVRARWCALGRDAGAVRIPPIDYGAPGNFGGLELGRDADVGEAVARVTLDSWNLDDVDFIKIDVEGMELDVLAGAEKTIARTRPVMSVEADREHQVADLLAWLTAHDYRAWWHKPELGAIWPGIISINLLAIPREREDLPAPTLDVEEAVA